MKKSIVAAMVLILSSLSTQASDVWDNCISSNGYFQTEHGFLSLTEENPDEEFELGKLIKKISIKTRKETCKLVNARRTVVSLDEEVSFEVFQVKGKGQPFNVDFICVRGGSGIPANDECDEKTARLVETYRVK